MVPRKQEVITCDWQLDGEPIRWCQNEPEKYKNGTKTYCPYHEAEIKRREDKIDNA